MLLSFALFALGSSLAQNGILPGEPDPNYKRHSIPERHDTVLLDDRKPCPIGKKRYQKLICAKQKPSLDCEDFHPVLECYHEAPQPRCQKNESAFGAFACETKK